MGFIVAPIAAALTPFLGASTALLASQFLVGTAISTLAGFILAPEQMEMQRPGIVTKFEGRGDVAAQSIPVGRVATAGHAMCPDYTWDTKGGSPKGPDQYYESIGKGRYLTRVISLADVPITGLVGLYVDGVYFNYPGDFVADTKRGMKLKAESSLTDEQKDYFNRLYVDVRIGLQNVTIPMLKDAFGNHPKRPWKTTSVHKGAAFVAITFKMDYDVYRGVPETLFVIDGIKLLDPRTGVVGWTENPAVINWNLYQSISFGPYKYGVGYPRSALPDSVWFPAMNKCDASAPNGRGGTEKAYRAGYEIRVAQPEGGEGIEPLDAIDIFNRAMSAKTGDSGGQVFIQVGAPALPSAALNGESILWSESEKIMPSRSIADIYNSVTATYPDSARKWETTAAKVLRDEEAIARLGEERQGSVNLQAVHHRSQVHRNIQAWLKDAQRRRQHAFVLPARWAAKMQLFATFTLTFAPYGYSNKLFEIQEVEHDLDTGQVAVLCREVDPNDWSTVGFTLPLGPAVPVGKVPISPFNLGALTVSAIASPDDGGVERSPGILVEWDADDREVGAVTVEIRRAGTTAVVIRRTQADGKVGSLPIYDGVNPNTDYEVRAKGLVNGASTATSWYFVRTLNRKILADALDTVSFSAAGLNIFGGTLQSSEFVSGTNGVGWRIRSNGSAEFGTLALRENALTNVAAGDLKNGGSIAISCLSGSNLLIIISINGDIPDLSPANAGNERWKGVVRRNGTTVLSFDARYEYTFNNEGQAQIFTQKPISKVRAFVISALTGTNTISVTLDHNGALLDKWLDIAVIEFKR